MAANPNNHSELARIKEEERKKAIKVHEDVGVMKRKEPTKFWKWFSEMFLSGRTWKDICMDIINNQIVPELKDGFRNSVVSMLDMRLYRDHRAGTSSPSGTPTSFVTNYVQYGDKKAQQQAALDARPSNRRPSTPTRRRKRKPSIMAMIFQASAIWRPRGYSWTT